MQISQQVTKYHQEPKLPRGLFLYEHRRCYNEIIDYCNKLCYQGKLLPKRGPKPANSKDGLPAFGYLHVPGKCQEGRRENELEAKTIAKWIATYKDYLEDSYQKPIHEILGIITPFVDQSQAIVSACRARKLKAGQENNGIIVGTIHSLQGAERHIIIFSPTYSKHIKNRSFIDKSPRMLNVAVSRAKDAFFVFGDMDALSASPAESPSKKLVDFVTAGKKSEIIFEIEPREDLIRASNKNIKRLVNAASHDRFLTKILESAEKEVHIVSPWIKIDRLKMHAPHIYQATKRGVAVYIYSDEKKINEMIASGDRQSIELISAEAKKLEQNSYSKKYTQ